jgi:hypothetical protein
MGIARALGALIVVVAAQVSVTGCSRSATVHTRNGGDVEGRIEENRGGTLHLTRHGEPVEVPAADVVEIDHPGDTALSVGMFLLVLGAPMILADPPTGGSKCNSDGACYPAHPLGQLGVVAAATGVGIGAYGLTVHLMSASHAEPGEKAIRGGVAVAMPLD